MLQQLHTVGQTVQYKVPVVSTVVCVLLFYFYPTLAEVHRP